MKRIVFIIVGTLAGILFVHGTTIMLGSLFGPLYAGEEDMQRNFNIYFVAMILIAVAGGIVGNWLYARRVH